VAQEADVLLFENEATLELWHTKKVAVSDTGDELKVRLCVCFFFWKRTASRLIVVVTDTIRQRRFNPAKRKPKIAADHQTESGAQHSLRRHIR
jgi:hypothetical protein